MAIELKGKDLYLVLAGLLLAMGALMSVYSAVTSDQLDTVMLVLGLVQLGLAVGLIMKYSIAYYGTLVLTALAVIKILVGGDLGSTDTLMNLMVYLAVLVLLIMGTSMQAITAKLPARIAGENGYKFFRRIE
jgi:hypothetical protein